MASSSVEMMVCNYLDVHFSALNPSWLSCQVWCLSPYVEKMLVSKLVNSLYIMLARAIGLWLVRQYGLPIL